MAKLDGKSVKSVQGGSIRIEVEGKTLTVNKAKVVKSDIACSNGLIHVIDTVIMPPAR
jgi:uncharacterized surface protein with fasciclin (FAS1) repeats